MPNFEFDLKKLKWSPACISDIVNAVSSAFEVEVTLKELEIFGTDGVNRTRLEKDEDMSTFLNRESMTNEKLIKLKIPERILSRQAWKPKKTKVLIRGTRIAKFFAEEQVSTRQVELSLKLFDCGHFHLKQTLQGNEAEPYWVIFEGRWRREDRVYRLTFLLRYAWVPKGEHPIEAARPGQVCSMALCGSKESQINGSIPAIVGQEPLCWVELCREPDKIENSKIRFNDEDDVPAADTLAPSGLREVDGRGRDQAWNAHHHDSCENMELGDEPIWPLVVGLVLFIAVAAVFAWGWWESHSPAAAFGVFQDDVEL